MHPLALRGLHQVLPTLGRAHGVGPVGVPVGVVGGENHAVVASGADGIGDRLLTTLDPEVAASAGDVLAGLHGQPRGLVFSPLLHLFVQPVHHVGHPANARLQEGEAYLGEPLQHPAHDRAAKSDHVLDGEVDAVDVDEVVEPGVADGEDTRARMVGQRHVQSLGLGVDGVVVAVAPVGSLRHVDGHHGPHCAQLGDGSAHFRGTALCVLRGYQAGELQPVGVGLAEVV